MLSQFNFKGFQPDDAFCREANRALDRILNQAPYDAVAAALIEKTDTAYRCAVDIYSKHGPFISSGSGATVEEALAHLEKALTAKLASWREKRFLKPGPDPRLRSTCSVA